MVFVMSALSLQSVAQKIRKSNQKKVVLDQQDEIVTYANSDIFLFPNVNKIAYYNNPVKYREIHALDRRRDWEKLYPKLRNYVANFGIENFYKDTYWIWRLAKLTELYGEMSEAKLLYKLVLRHHRQGFDVKEIELYYDSLTANEQDYYVPLDYYYELVEYRKEVDTLQPPRGVLLNMGSLVNSGSSDYGPALNVNDSLLIFTSRRNSYWNGLEMIINEDLYFTKMFYGDWDSANPFEEINTQYNEGSACLSKDGQTLFFSRCDAPGNYGGCDLFYARMQEDSTWGEITNLGANVNSRSWDSHPSLTHTEDTLYFASDRIGGFGLSDIYYTYKDNSGEWVKAQNAGPVINTRHNEVSPFYHHRHDVLYFSSNGQNLNFGEFDIYKTYREEDNWSEPLSTGPLVNGPGSEFYFTIDSESRDLYYARSAENDLDNLDLYSFPLPMEAQPLATTTISGTVTDTETGVASKGIVSIIDLDNGIEVAPKYLRPDGTFEFQLINHSNYLLIIQGENFFRIEELFYLDTDTTLYPKVLPVSSKIKFESIVFGNGISDLTPEMYPDLDKVANFLIDNPDYKLKISGHTDSDGREEFNLQLSQERAEAIMEYVIYFGKISPTRITAKGFGSSKPILKEDTEEAKELNRRVEFEIFKDPAKSEKEGDKDDAWN